MNAMRSMPPRRALNRGTAVYLGGAKVRLVWPCGCTREEDIVDPHQRPLSPGAVQLLVRRWRHDGVTLEQCKRHPAWYSPQNQVPRLNEEHPNA